MASATPVATAVPTLGPFNVDGFSNCFYNGNGGLSCNSQATCVVCEGSEACAQNTGDCDFHGIDGYGGYETEMICTW